MQHLFRLMKSDYYKCAIGIRVQKPVGALDYYRYRIRVNAANSKVIGQTPTGELDYYRYRSGITIHKEEKHFMKDNEIRKH